MSLAGPAHLVVATGLVCSLIGQGAPAQEQATLAQRASAQRIVAQTTLGIARYRDPSMAVLDGYRPVTPLNWPIVEWVNPAYARAGRTLDPRHPERLMYLTSGRGPILAGAMFVLPHVADPRPAVGGPLLHWHRHLDLCFLPNGTIAGTNGYGFPCPPGSTPAPTALMLHVWIVPNPAGPFAEDLPPGVIQAVVNA